MRPLGPSELEVRLRAHEGFDFIADSFARYGDVVRTRFDGAEIVYVRHPDHILEVMIGGATKFKKRPDLVPFLGQGLLTSEGELWRSQRRIIQPAFHRERIEGYARGMVEETGKVLRGWRDGEVRDVAADMSRVTLAIVCRALFGHDTTREAAVIGRVMRVYQEATARGRPGPDVDEAQRTMDEIVERVVSRRRADPSSGTDLLAAMLAESDGRPAMSASQLRDELLTLFLAGHETTAQGLSWTWMLLARHRSVERRLHAELDAVLGRRLPTSEDLERLELLDRVILESLRLYPPAYSLPRIALEDTSVGGFEVRAGTQVILCTYACHHDPRWFPEPEVFDPDRWLPGSDRVTNPLAFLAFGAGSRACVGKHFARLEMGLVIATIARRFRLGLAKGQVVEPAVGVTLHPRGGLPMRVARR